MLCSTESQYITLYQAKKEETIFTVYTPPHVGFYKLEIYASRVPKTKGKINLPLVATFMLEVCLKRLLRTQFKDVSRCG